MTGILKCSQAIVAALCVLIWVGPHSVSADVRDEGPLIPESLVHLDCTAPPNYALVVEKKSQTIRVYACDDEYRLLHSFPCSTGEMPGKKTRAGDRKTPEGVYFFTAACEKRYLSSTYGNGAFVMDYPNALDRLYNRTGDSIWLHGTNETLQPRDTNGCVTVQNGDIDILARYIRLNLTPIIIKAKLNMVPPEACRTEAEALRRFLEAWKGAFLSGDKGAHAAYYKTIPPNHDRVWDAWAPIRASWLREEVPVDMVLGDIAIARANPCLVVLLDQSLEVDGHVATVGRKKLFVEAAADGWKILAEAYQDPPPPERGQDRVILSMQGLERLRRDYREVAERVTEWANAWSGKDMERYRACYAEDFRARGMDLPSWIHYKKRLSRRYDFISVSVEDLNIEQEGDRSTATFLQRYASSHLESVGTKRLRLKRVDGGWKIYREKWFKADN